MSSYSLAKDQSLNEDGCGRVKSPQRQILEKVWRHPLGRIGIILLVLFILMAVLAPILAPFDPSKQFPGNELLPPGKPYWLGTDDFGRDILSRLIYGSQISLMVSLVAVSIGASLGCIAGLVAGYFGGWVDTLIMRTSDLVLAYPAILVGIAIVIVIGPGKMNVAYALAIINFPEFARLMRASVLVQRECDYVLSARCIGVPNVRILWRHLLPNCLGPILVQLSLSMGFAILLEAGLSFLGLGAQPPTPSWGSMLNDSRSFLRYAWWYGVFPGLALALLIFALNGLSDALQDAVNPQRRNQ